MKKLLSKLTLMITCIITYTLSYTLELMGIYYLEKSFVYILATIVFCISLKILLGVLSNDYQNSKLLVILYMIIIYCLILLFSWIATKLMKIDFEKVCILIFFGISLGNVIRVDNECKTKQRLLKDN